MTDHNSIRIKKVPGIITAILVLLFYLSVLPVPSVLSQEINRNEFVGRGVSPIKEGDMAGARHAALEDAKEKVVLSAVCSILTMPDFSQYFLTIRNLFISHPDIYLKWFKIISENSAYDTYHVTIRGLVQEEQLLGDLKSMGITEVGIEKLKVLVMVAQKDIGSDDYRYWWGSSDNASMPENISQKRLENYLEEKGAEVIDPSGVSGQAYSDAAFKSPDPPSDSLLQIGLKAGADLVLIARSELRLAENGKIASFTGVQCDMSAKLIDVRSGDVVVQSSAYGLGIHVDRMSATLDAVNKAGKQICENLMNRVYLQLRNMNEYKLELSFDNGGGEPDARGWIDSFLKIFPEIEVLGVENDSSNHLWLVTIRSQIQAADILQKLLETGCEGYKTDVVSVDDRIIMLKIHIK